MDRIASPATPPAATASQVERRSWARRTRSTSAARRTPSTISRFTWTSCQTRYGWSVATSAAITPIRTDREVSADREDEQRGDRREGDLREPDDDPGAVERPVEPGEEPGVERLGVGGRDVRQEAERPARDERARERVALLDVLLEDVVALDREGDEARQDGGGRHQEDGAAWYALRDAAHDSGTVRRGLVSRRTAARRRRLGRVRLPPGASPGRARGRCADAAARSRSRRARRRDVGRGAPTRPRRARRSATTRTSRARRTHGPPAAIPVGASAARPPGSRSRA